MPQIRPVDTLFRCVIPSGNLPHANPLFGKHPSMSFAPPELPLRMRRRSWLPRAIFESTLIVFSVLFALLLNEWRSGVAQSSRADQAVAAIHSELAENQRLINEAREYHMSLAESFTASAQMGAETPDLSAVRHAAPHGNPLRMGS